MIIRRQQLRDVFQTGREMKRLTVTYWADLGRWLEVPFIDFYRFVCCLPYREDPEQIETVSRPLFLLDDAYSPRDCDDKAVLCASWWHGHGVPVRFVAISTQPTGELNHVFTQIEDGTDIDATYKEFSQYMGKYPYYSQVTNRENLTSFF